MTADSDHSSESDFERACAAEFAGEKFQSKVMPEPNSGCWLWVGAASGSGYGTFNIGGKTYLAHRVAYAASGGRLYPKGSGIVLDHICSTPSCVNPAHLRQCTYRDNRQAGLDGRPERGIPSNRETMCKSGRHKLEGLNAMPNKERGRRQCRACCNEKRRKRYWARKQAMLDELIRQGEARQPDD